MRALYTRTPSSLVRRCAIAILACTLLCHFGTRSFAQDAVRLLSDDSTSLLHRLDLIDAANHEVFLSTYEVGDDPVALKILSKLRAAAARGVCVRLIVDGHGKNNLMPKPLMRHLIASGVDVREHLPDIRYRLDIGRQRMHDKLLIVDGQQMLIGGRNTKANYYGMAKENFLDREIYLVGKTAQHARNYFLQRWQASTSGRPTLDRKETNGVREEQNHACLNDLPCEQAVACAAKLLDQAEVAELPLSDSCCHHHGLQCQCEAYHSIACIRFLHDLPEQPKDHPAAIACQLNQLVSRAQSCIMLETPYPVFSDELRKSLLDARERNVQITIITNSLETTNKTVAHAQYANERHWLRRAGIQLWELKGCRCMHAKSLVIDGRISMIGSYNFDLLSETRNSEVAVVMDDCAFADALMEQMNQHRRMAQPVPQDGPLLRFDAKSNSVENEELREVQILRIVTPFIKKYL